MLYYEIRAGQQDCIYIEHKTCQNKSYDSTKLILDMEMCLKVLHVEKMREIKYCYLSTTYLKRYTCLNIYISFSAFFLKIMVFKAN